MYVNVFIINKLHKNLYDILHLQTVDYLDVENHFFDNVDHFFGNSVVGHSFDSFVF